MGRRINLRSTVSVGLLLPIKRSKTNQEALRKTGDHLARREAAEVRVQTAEHVRMKSNSSGFVASGAKQKWPQPQVKLHVCAAAQQMMLSLWTYTDLKLGWDPNQPRRRRMWGRCVFARPAHPHSFTMGSNTSHSVTA